MTPLPQSGSLDSDCSLNTVCQEGLNCFAGFCLNNEVIQIIGNDCTDSNECGEQYGSNIGECRNMVCGLTPAVSGGEECYYGYECDEGLDCFWDEL